MGYFCSVASSQVCMLFLKGQAAVEFWVICWWGRGVHCCWCLCSMRSTPASSRWTTKARPWRGRSSPWSTASTQSPHKQSWRKERGKQLQVPAWEPVHLDSEQSAAWALCWVMILTVESCGLHCEQFWKDHLSKCLDYSRLWVFGGSVSKIISWCDGSYMPCHCVCSGKPVGRAGLVSSLAPVWSIFNFLIVSWCLNRGWLRVENV